MSSRGRVLKVVVIGDGAVGKTCMLLSYINGGFNEEHIPTVFDNQAGKITFKGVDYNFTLWDTAGQEGYDRCRVLCYPGTSVFLVAFSIANRTSFENISAIWVPEVRKECGDNIPLVLIGTKSDLRNESSSKNTVKKKEGIKLAKKLNMFCYVECSARTKEGLGTVFEKAVESFITRMEKKSSCVLQ